MKFMLMGHALWTVVAAKADPAAGTWSGQTVLIAVVSALLGAPFLNFILSLMRNRVTQDNVIVTGAGATVTAMQQALEGLRKELEEVRSDLTEARAELHASDERHRAEISELRDEHQSELAAIRQDRDALRRKVSDLEQAITPNG